MRAQYGSIFALNLHFFFSWRNKVPVRTKDFDYDLPEELIADRPLLRRDDSRMLVVHRDSGCIEHRMFRDLPEYMNPGDLFVMNDTRVVPSRFFSNDGKIEIVRAGLQTDVLWKCMVRPGKRMKIGRTVQIGDAIGIVEAIDDEGYRLIRFDRHIDETTYGRLALPHYMNRESDPSDKERYQTVYASHEGAIAAPTAGLHFSQEMLDKVPHAFLTLHVGAGTFRPVKTDCVEEHRMHTEHFVLPESTAQRIAVAKRIIAVGTTSVRVLEHLAAEHGLPLKPGAGDTHIFIYPPYRFQVVDALLTNFHLPQSTLIMLVSALAGRELILEAYRQAVERRYRFFSYGDCMLIL